MTEHNRRMARRHKQTHFNTRSTSPKTPSQFQHYTVVIVLLISCVVLTDGRLLNDFQEEEIGRVGRLVLDCGKIPGMSVVLVKGSDWWTQSLGVANMTSQDAVKESTNFVIASLTKAFTSTLLLMLLKESKEGYTMNTSLKDILEQDDLFPDAERSKGTTVKDILSHRMGLARADLALFAGYPEDFRLQELSSAVSCLPVQTPFRDGFGYSNFMYSLAGHVIEKLTNQSYEDVLRDRILKPLGMTSTLTRYNFSNPEDAMAQPYMFVDGKVVPAHHSLFRLPVFLPALGLATNARDMAIWLQTLMNQGVSPSGQQVIHPEVIAMTQYPVTPCIINQLRPRYSQTELTFAYGLGWFQSTYKGFRRIWHAGSLYGFTSITWLFPDMNIAVFATTNGPSRKQDTKTHIKTILSYIVDPILGFPSWVDQSKCIYSNSLNQQQLRSHGAGNSISDVEKGLKGITTSCNKFNQSYVYSSEELERYIGFYYNKLFGKVEVQLVGDSSTILNQSVLSQKCSHFNKTPGKILRVTFGERFTGILHATTDKNLFRMEPTGIFEFSAHPQGDKETTMPVEFFLDDSTDKDAVAHSVMAVWQAVEMITYGRYSSQEMCYRLQEDGLSGGVAQIGYTYRVQCFIIYSLTAMHVIVQKVIYFW